VIKVDEVDRLIANASAIKADRAVPAKKSVLVPYQELLKHKQPAIITEKCVSKWNNNEHVLAVGTVLYFVTEAGPFGRDSHTKLTGVYMQSLVWGSATMYSMASVPRECVRLLTTDEVLEFADRLEVK